MTIENNSISHTQKIKTSYFVVIAVVIAVVLVAADAWMTHIQHKAEVSQNNLKAALQINETKIDLLKATAFLPPKSNEPVTEADLDYLYATCKSLKDESVKAKGNLGAPYQKAYDTIIDGCAALAVKKKKTAILPSDFEWLHALAAKVAAVVNDAIEQDTGLALKGYDQGGATTPTDRFISMEAWDK